MGSGFVRGTCLFEDCPHKQFYVGKNKSGIRYYGKYCNKHRKMGVGKNYSFSLTKNKIKHQFKNEKCSKCGWNKGPCDRHRKVPSLGYRKGNVIILCPNCHRLETFGLNDSNTCPHGKKHSWYCSECEK